MVEMIVMYVDGGQDTKAVSLPPEPEYRQLRDLIVPYLDGGDLERVRVLYDDHATDMFVDERGHMKGLPRNEAATKIYRAATLRREPNTEPESLPFIVGPAVLFDQSVWF